MARNFEAQSLESDRSSGEGFSGDEFESVLSNVEADNAFTESQITEKTISFPQKHDTELIDPPVYVPGLVKEPPVVLKKEQRERNAGIIEKVVQGNHFSGAVTKYLDNIVDKKAMSAAPKGVRTRLRHFDASAIEEDLDYGNSLKEKRLSPARLAGGIVGGIAQRIRVGGARALLNRTSIIETRGAMITVLRECAVEEEHEKPAVADFLTQLADKLENTNDRDRMLHESRWYRPNLTINLSDKTLKEWRAKYKYDIDAEIVSDKPPVVISEKEQVNELFDPERNKNVENMLEEENSTIVRRAEDQKK